MATPRASSKGSSVAGLRAVHERFVTGDVSAPSLASSLRPVVAQSWLRSLSSGVNPDHVAAQAVSDDLVRIRDAHPLASALPVIRRLLVDDAFDSGVIVAVTAADGTLLWVEGDLGARRRAETMNFVPGADWSERGAGTNAPGTAIALDAELQIRGAEHFSRVVQPWSCTAVPVHDPATGALIGAIDLTGRSQVTSQQTLALVRATAVAVENHLALIGLTRPVGAPPGVARLTVLGADRPRWEITAENGHVRTNQLTGRHAEILVLLSRHPEGLSADHLALLLDDKDLDSVTIRAELSRLRRVVGAGFIDSRPYRLVAPIASDMDEVYGALKTGDVDAALTRYTGELLPRSVSPAVARLRTELSTSMRSAVLATKDMGLLRRWLELPEGRDDRHGWHVLHDQAQSGSVTRAQAHGHLAGLDLDLA